MTQDQLNALYEQCGDEEGVWEDAVQRRGGRFVFTHEDELDDLVDLLRADGYTVLENPATADVGGVVGWVVFKPAK